MPLGFDGQASRLGFELVLLCSVLHIRFNSACQFIPTSVEFGRAEGTSVQLADGGEDLGICSTAYTAESFEMESVASEGYHWPAQVKREEAPMGKILTGLPSLLTYGGDLSGWRRLTERIAVPMADIHILVIGGSMASGVIARPLDPGCQMLAPDGQAFWNVCPSASNFYRPPDGSNVADKECKITRPPDGSNIAYSGSCHHCAFATRFEFWLQKAYPTSNITVHNLAIGGVGSEYHATHLSHSLDVLHGSGLLPHADAVLLHLVDNDHAEADFQDSQDGSADRLDKGDTPVCPYLKSADAKAPHCIQKGRAVEASYENIIRLVASKYKKQPPFLALQQCGARKCKTSYNASDLTVLNMTKPNFLKQQDRGHEGEYSLHSRANHHYQIPIMNIDALEELKRLKTDIHDWNLTDIEKREVYGYRHPSWPAHQLIADSLAYFWRSIACELPKFAPIAQGALPPPLYAATAGCSVPFAYLSSEEMFKVHGATQLLGPCVIEATGNWTLGPDQKGRQRIGWWVDTPHGGATIKFNMNFTTRPVLSISYLTSYAHMGRAQVRVDGKLLTHNGRTPKIISARRQDTFSLVETSTFCLHTNTAAEDMLTFDNCDRFADSLLEPAMWRNRPQTGSAHVVEVELLPDSSLEGNKFKVTDLSSC
jgi:hypothetical protein